jgi:hypothetical protein
MVLSPRKPARDGRRRVYGTNQSSYVPTMLNLNRQANDKSLSLDLLGAVAAQMVCVGHGLPFFHIAAELRPLFIHSFRISAC